MLPRLADQLQLAVLRHGCCLHQAAAWLDRSILDPDSYKASVQALTSRARMLQAGTTCRVVHLWASHHIVPHSLAAQLALGQASGCVLQSWVKMVAAHLRAADPNHLITIGEEGFWRTGPSTSFNPTGSCAPAPCVHLVCIGQMHLTTQAAWPRPSAGTADSKFLGLHDQLRAGWLFQNQESSTCKRAWLGRAAEASIHQQASKQTSCLRAGWQDQGLLSTFSSKPGYSGVIGISWQILQEHPQSAGFAAQ